MPMRFWGYPRRFLTPQLADLPAHAIGCAHPKLFGCLIWRTVLADFSGTAVLGLVPGVQTRVTLPAGEALLTVLSLRNPTQAELDRLLMPIKAPEIEEEE